MPTIETIDRIASALGVPIERLVENLSWQDRQKTREFKIIEKAIEHSMAGVNGVVAALIDIYGSAELKCVEAESGASSSYYLVGENENQFILYEDAVEDLVEFVKSAIKPLVERIKASKSEQEIIDEFLDHLNSPETKKWIENSEARL